MGSWKKIRKAVTKPFQIKKDLFRKVAGKALGSSGGSGDERSEAASELIKKDVQRQAGGAQINFTTEEWT